MTPNHNGLYPLWYLLLYLYFFMYLCLYLYVDCCWPREVCKSNSPGVSPVWGVGGRGGSKQPQERHFLLALKNPVAWTPADLLWLPSFPRYRQYSTLNHTPTNPKTHPPLHLPPGQLFNYFLHDSHTFHQYNMIYNQRMSPEILYPIPRKMASFSK